MPSQVSFEAERRGRAQTEEEKAMWPQKQSLEGPGHKPRSAESHPGLEEARERFLP